MTTLTAVDDGDLQLDARPDANDPAVWQLAAVGELDAANAERVQPVIDAALAEGARTVLLDLSALTFLDSTGLRALLVAAKQLAALDGELRLVALSSPVKRLLELTDTTDRFGRPLR